MKNEYYEAGAQAPATNKEELAKESQSTWEQGVKGGIHQKAYWRKQNRHHGTVSWMRY